MRSSSEQSEGAVSIAKSKLSSDGRRTWIAGLLLLFPALLIIIAIPTIPFFSWGLGLVAFWLLRGRPEGARAAMIGMGVLLAIIVAAILLAGVVIGFRDTLIARTPSVTFIAATGGALAVVFASAVYLMQADRKYRRSLAIAAGIFILVGFGSAASDMAHRNASGQGLPLVILGGVIVLVLLAEQTVQAIRSAIAMR